MMIVCHRVLLSLVALAGLCAAAAPSQVAESPRAKAPAPTPSLLESDPGGWTSIQPAADLAGWTRLPWPATASLGPQQWSVDRETGHLVCDGKGGHDWLRYDREMGDAAFHVEWRFTPVEGADKYNSGVLVRTLSDLSAWHQAQVGLRGGFLFGLTPVGGQPRRVNLSEQLEEQRVRPAGEWNVYELVAKGRTVSLWVNGAVTSRLDACEVPRGYFGLEGEGWRIEFRKLLLKTLSP
jgi:hypothetical protein